MTLEFQKRYYITKKTAKDLTELASCMYDRDNPAVEINNPKPLLERLGITKPLEIVTGKPTLLDLLRSFSL